MYTISIDLFRIYGCVILYLQYDMNMLKIRIELAIYIEMYSIFDFKFLEMKLLNCNFLVKANLVEDVFEKISF